MEKINIVLPFEKAEQYVNLWAFEEEEIDFEKEKARGERCTMCFGAAEMVKYLTVMGFSAAVSSAEEENAVNILLICGGGEEKDCSFAFIPRQNGFEILGGSRTGVLYGCYEFLKQQGIRWYAPGSHYEFIPKHSAGLKLPQEKMTFLPEMSRGRGFDFEGILKESADLCLWMARNKLNIASYRVHTDSLMKKLGMTYKVGGHIFEKMLNPDTITENGDAFWEAHNDWYGTPENGEKEKYLALSTQFCVSNDELICYLAENVIRLLNTEWKNASRVDIWGFDTWGKTCSCERCKKLGNGTDKTLHFMSKLRQKINDSGFDRKIELVMCAYEGTSTVQPPQNAIPPNLKENGDLIVFYPITRCYAHDFSDRDCDRNKMFCEALEAGWQYCQNIRAWGSKSILSQLLTEQSDREPLRLDNHFQSEEALIADCENNVKKLEKALEISKEVYKRVKEDTAVQSTNLRLVNPEQARKLLLSSGEFVRISEDIRFITYGLDTMRLTKSIIEYHNKMLKNEDTQVLWNEIEELYDKLNSYYIPITFSNSVPETECRDALTRTQLRPVADRYRMRRREAN